MSVDFKSKFVCPVSEKTCIVLKGIALRMLPCMCCVGIHTVNSELSTKTGKTVTKRKERKGK